MAPSTQETLAEEARDGPRAGAAAIAAGLLVFAGTVVTTLVFQGAPEDDESVVSVADALRNRVQEGRPSPSGLTVDQATAFGDSAVPLALGGLLFGVGVLLLLPALGYLLRALRARAPQQRGVLKYALVVGTVLTAVGFTAFVLFLAIGAAGFDGGPGATAGEARETLTSGTVLVGQFMYGIGRIVLAVAIALIALNAMRAGLLTRFLGILGVVVGLLWVLPFDQFALIRGVWFVALGLLFLHRFPRTAPPAWASGQAEPWPTRQELREGRTGRQADPQPDGPDAPEPEPAGTSRRRRGRP